MVSAVNCCCCGAIPSQKCSAFLLSNCGHVVCKNCVTKGYLEAKCKFCNAASPKFVAIDRNLAPALQEMFKPTAEVHEEQSKELHQTMQFQLAQYSTRSKMEQMQLTSEKNRSSELKTKLTAMNDQMNNLKRQFNEAIRRSRSASRDSGHQNSERADISNVTTSTLSHHTTSSTINSLDSTTYSDPFKTPGNRPKKFMTSTPKVPYAPGMSGQLANTLMNSHLPSLSPINASTRMEVDEDIVDVTPAISNKARSTHPPPPLPTKTKSNNMMIDCDPIIVDGPSMKPAVAKTPAPRKSNNMSMADRLSQPRSAVVQKSVTSAAAAATPNIKAAPTPAARSKTSQLPTTTPMQSSRMVPATPLVSETKNSHSTAKAASALPEKRPPTTNADGFKTPTVPVKRPNPVPNTMPARVKLGTSSSKSSVVLPQP